MPSHRFLQCFAGESSAAHGLPPEARPAVLALGRAAGRAAGGRGGVSSRGVFSVHAVMRGAANVDIASTQAELLDRLGGAAPWQAHGVDLVCSPAPLRTAPNSLR